MGFDGLGAGKGPLELQGSGWGLGGGYLGRVLWGLVVVWGGSHRGLGSCLGRALGAMGGGLYGEDLLGSWRVSGKGFMVV